MNKSVRLAVWLFLILAGSLFALGPNELVLIVNGDSLDSKTVANAYVALRKIPAQNVVYLADIPKGDEDAPNRIKVGAFRQSIYEPVIKALRERGLDHVTTWIYSVDLPVSVKTGATADMSIHGITLTRGTVPSSTDVKKGEYVSSLYGGPKLGTGVVDPAQSFSRSLKGTLERGPIPSMSLGFTGERGNSVKEVVLCLKRGVMADGSLPQGTVYFVENSDVRTTCRKWQFEPAQKILNQLRVRSVITTNVPQNDPAILGVIDGRMYVKPREYGQYVLGAMAEHLTSCSAMFHVSGHTKCTAWIEAGATASAGAVTEPYALWPKFPAATFFVYYAQGCSIIESFYQSVRCPLQLYMIGEPLATPWRKAFSVTTIALEDPPFKGVAEFYSRVLPKPPPSVGFVYKTYVDGREIPHRTDQTDVKLDTRELSDGYHTLRFTAEFGQGVVWQGFDDTGFVVNNRGRSVSLQGIAAKQALKITEDYSVVVDATEKPEKVGICYGSKVLDERSGGGAKLRFVAKELGAGPCKIQAYAIYDDGNKVFSEPVSVNVRK